MANRHLSRSIVLQTLFEWDFNGQAGDPKEMLKRNTVEFGPGLNDDAFLEMLLDGVLRKRTVIDDIITKAAPEWPVAKIAVPDRNILRIGLYELLFGNRSEVPPKVAINEAIELAKAFGGDNSSRFINGVLGAVYKEIGEPGKEQFGKKQVQNEPIDITKLPIEKKAGAVIFGRYDGGFSFALVHDVFGYWTLSKGGVEEAEAVETAVMRVVKEEVGIETKVVEALGENEYVASHPEKGKLRKQVTYFLVEAPYEALTLRTGGGLDDARWFSPSEVVELRMYDDVVGLIEKATEIITSQQ